MDNNTYNTTSNIYNKLEYKMETNNQLNKNGSLNNSPVIDITQIPIYKTYKCTQCGVDISYNFYNHNNNIYCAIDYKELVGDYCTLCKDNDIKGPIMKINNIEFHPECFICSICSCYINTNQCYSLFNNQYLYCWKCLNKVHPLVNKPMLHQFQKLNQLYHNIYILKYNINEIYDNKLPKFKVDFILKAITPPTTLIDNNEIEINIKENCADININEQISSPKYGFQIIKYIPLNSLANNNPIIHTNDILLMIDDRPCVQENYNLIHDLINNHFKDITYLFVLRLISNVHTIEHDSESQYLDANDGITRSESVTTLPSYRRKLNNSREEKDKICTMDMSDTDLNKQINRKLSNPVEFPSPSHVTPTNSIMSHSRRNKSDICVLQANNHIQSFKNKRTSCWKYFEFTKSSGANLLVRSQSQNLSNANNQVFTENDLVFQEILGEGFFGIAIKVINIHTREEYAMKQLKVINNLTLNNFRKEVQLMKSLNHPNLVKFIGVFLSRENIDVIMEFVGGGTLKKYIKYIRKKTNPMFTATQMYSIVLGISSGMAYLHSKNIAHRDLTSSNCLLRDHQSLNVVISDFGLSEVITQKHKKLAVVGSPYWMAPEMLNGKLYDTNVDIFSFGIIICEITTLLDANPDYLQRNKDFGLNLDSYLINIHPNVPDKLSNLAIRCCSIDPLKRPQFSSIHNLICIAIEKLQ